MDAGILQGNRCTLIERWVTRKILRDRNVDRITVGGDLDGIKLVAKMFGLMEQAALSMTARADDRGALNESIPEDTLNGIGQRVFGTTGDLVLGILLNSVLISGQHRTVDKGLSRPPPNVLLKGGVALQHL
jgi:hypothetical protein